jgi:hypothetical protein
MEKRKFSKEEKLRLIKEASEQGVSHNSGKARDLSGCFYTVGRGSLTPWLKMASGMGSPLPISKRLSDWKRRMIYLKSYWLKKNWRVGSRTS